MRRVTSKIGWLYGFFITIALLTGCKSHDAAQNWSHTSNDSSLTPSRDDLPYLAADLIADLRNNRAKDFATALGNLPTPPPKLVAKVAAGDARKFSSGAEREALNLSSALLNMASETSRHGVWRFADKDTNTYFEALFQRIVEATKVYGFDFSFSTEDLFHGHLFTYENDLGILFHAKEYPSNLFTNRKRRATFDTHAKEYPYRNFIWLLRSNQVWMLKTLPGTPLFEKLIYPSWLDPSASEFKDVAVQCQEAKTLQTEYFDNLGQTLGSLNYFLRHDWYELDPQAPAENGLLFFTFHNGSKEQSP